MSLAERGSLNKHSDHFFEGARPSIKKIAQFMDADNDQMAKILDKSPRTIYRDKVTQEVREKLKPIIYGLMLLLEIAEPAEIKIWLHKPLIEWDGRSPMDELQRGNIEGVLNLIRRIHDGEGGY